MLEAIPEPATWLLLGTGYWRVMVAPKENQGSTGRRGRVAGYDKSLTLDH